ncbi:UNC-like C-terminal-domain-containing protein [Desarmillaria tabescens]|uniref:UNC-like C-terminal-domain-containing protein n=1 Tax=Armillaria tabescens TaxID=1929756 RepID=A0AA39N764_ARMTA|nr:UNC-like C-terminal-domain-containing protein [Desarmillaria tabescens]KAK0460009.1 UNC-like C-terminal-domain-containing protein [Desarmillaria tabescens]
MVNIQTALVALALASPVFAASPTSLNDPFRAISAAVSRESPPVCCLIPLEPVEPTDTDALLSFEEWKEKQAELQKREGKENDGNHPGNISGATGIHYTGHSDTVGSDGQTTSPLASYESMDEPISPHFQVPLTDRFNYAALDCSARVHVSHRSAKSPSSILSSKRDRYMLSPCTSKEKQFVIVELCDDIRIDTVQLANFEFFSGVFKDFTVSVAKTYTTREEGWTVAGTYRAKNVRGVQSFHPPTSLHDFYRYIRIEFHSHYGNEYYCPISLLRVYGLTHLEQWKWDVWEAEYRAKHEKIRSLPASVTDEPEPVQTSDPLTVVNVSATNIAEPGTETVDFSPIPESSNSPPEFGSATSESTTKSISTPITASSTETVSFSGRDPSYESDIHSTDTAQPSSTVHRPASTSFTDSASTNSTSDSDGHSSASAAGGTSSSASQTATTIVTASGSNNIPIPPPMPPTTGGESIYRTIMNRLTALEGNHTLYARYVEEQTTGVREMLRRLGEDVGRLDGLGKAQAQMYQKTLREWDKQRLRIEMDYRELANRVDYLSNEIILEKRLGIAQLCLLLAVLIFMGLTRGSRSEEHGPLMFRRSMREWGRRHLSFSGDWFTNRSRSTPPNIKMSPRPGDAKVEFPTSSVEPSAKPSLYTMQEQRSSSPTPQHRSRSHTPIPVRTPMNRHLNSSQLRPATPTSTSRPIIKRATSGGGLVSSTSLNNGRSAPRSARRWARTAHLHEVRLTNRQRRADDQGDDDPFLATTPSRHRHRGHAHINGVEAIRSSPEYDSSDDPFLATMERKSISPGPRSIGNPWSPSDEGESDIWLDTDASIDGSETEPDSG